MPTQRQFPPEAITLVNNAGRQKPLREMLYLADQAAEAGLKVIPGQSWAMHYPKGGLSRNQKLEGLLAGRFTVDQVVQEIKPDAIIYNLQDVEDEGMEAVAARIRDYSSTVAYYDYERFAKFVEAMQGTGMELEDVQKMYEGVARSRIRKKLLDAYGSTGQAQIHRSLLAEAKRSLRSFKNLSTLNRVMEALKAAWLCEEMMIIPPMDRDKFVADLSEGELALYKDLVKPYKAYAQFGMEGAYDALVAAIKKHSPKTEKVPYEQSQEAKDLLKDLEPFKDQAVPPGIKGDPDIPPEDEDEYNTRDPGPQQPQAPGGPGESKESAEKQESIFYIITPAGTSTKAMTGDYSSGHKSYFNVATATWSKRKQLSLYSSSPSNYIPERQTISGRVDPGTKSIPLPSGYRLDINTLQSEGPVKILRDQNGSFYIQYVYSLNQRNCRFSIQFCKETTPFIKAPIPEDLQPLYTGSLSAQTEGQITALTGDNVTKAQQAQAYVINHHTYPAGGNLQAAGALQHALRQGPPDAYVQRLDQSKYLECYSANTLFVAMMRKAGVPARLVVGHHIDSCRDGKALITDQTGHAWSEIWDDQAWCKVDATPYPKDEDKSQEDRKQDKQKNKQKQTPGEKAEENEIPRPPNPHKQEQPQEQDGDISDEVSESVAETEKSVAENDLPEEAGENEMQQGQQQLDQAQKKMQQMENKKQELKEKAAEADKFEDLEDIKAEAKAEDLMEDMKEEIEKQLEAQEKKLKEEMKEKAEKMADEGFMEESERDQILKDIDKKQNARDLDELKRRLDEDNRLYNEYEIIKDEIMPMVDDWYRYFEEKLPKEDNMLYDEDAVNRKGILDRKAITHPRALILGLAKNPRIIKPNIEPKYIAAFMVDVSGSMEGGKLKMARKMLIFYNELFSRLKKNYGYILSSIDVFSDGITSIQAFEHEYDSTERYQFPDGLFTIKARLMKAVRTQGGTNILIAVKKAAKDLNEAVAGNPDYASALYFMGDGGDTCGNEVKIREFMACNEAEKGFGDHLRSAILMGNESERKVLAELFGDEHTAVAPDFETLVETAMGQFDLDLMDYLDRKGLKS